MKTDKKIPNRSSSESGYALLLVMLIASISAMLMYRQLETSGVGTKVIRSSKERSTDFYAAETAFNQAVTWLRSNSTAMSMQFSRNYFYGNFDRASVPSVGSNDTSSVTVPGRAKSNSSTSTVMLSNDGSLGASIFPSGTDTVSGTTKYPAQTFASASFGTQKVKISLVDAIPVDATKDFGDSPNPSPQTDFNPVYRIDAMNSLTGGAHLFGYVTGSLIFDYGVGFYGRDLVEMRQNCDSYISNNGAYSNASKRANCTVGGGATAEIHQNAYLYGTLRTNGSIVATPPYGGKICSDFVAGCPNAGLTCQGASCNVPGLPTYSTWATYCPSNQGNVTINANTTLTVAGNASNQKCWNNITVNNNKILTLTTTNYPYFIDTFNIANNSVVAFSPSPGAGTINIYVRTFTGDKFNGNQMFNTNNKPYQLRIHYLGTNALTLNGTAAMNAFIVAPYAPVNVQGNFTFQGGIKATQLLSTGSGVLRYDESGDITTISGMKYDVNNLEQNYR